MRIEGDWQHHCLTQKVKKRLCSNERLMVNIDDLITMYKNSDVSNSNLFFTTGKNHQKIYSLLKENNIESSYFYDSNYDYFINAAINFQICFYSKIFIGNVGSTFSNLITLKRYFNNNDNSYIYNYNNKIIKRVDKGLHVGAYSAINNVVSIYVKFHIVYYVCMILDWERIVKQNSESLFESNILNDIRCDCMYITCTGNESDLDKLKSMFNYHSKIKFEYYGDDIKSHEYHGINKIKELSIKYPSDNLLYFHSKGITRGGRADDWNIYMEYFNIINYISCLDKLIKYDVVSVDFLRINSGRAIQGGNFWWTTSKHVSRLVVPDKYANRHDFERFILKTKEYVKIWSFHQSTETTDFEGFFKRRRRRYIPNDYVNKNKGREMIKNKR